MFLKELIIEGVRNLRSPRLTFDSTLSFLIGANGSGKTSVLEAVSLLCRGQSFRSPNVASVIRYGAPSLSVWGEIEDEARGALKVALLKTRTNETEVRVNGEDVQRASKLIEYMPLQIITAESASLVLGAPKARRRFMDWGLVHEHSAYLSWRREYQRVLRQRNACLRDQGRATDLLDAWDQRLVDVGQRIASVQAEYVQAVNQRLQTVLSELTAAPEEGQEVKISYHPGWQEAEDYSEVVRSSRQRDVKLGRTVAGPHASDVRVEVSKRAASRILSRGEAKSLSLALNIAQADRLQVATGRRSLFLVDELAGELDAKRRGLFLTLLASRPYQALAASAIALDSLGAKEAWLGEQGKHGGHGLFHVEQGQVTRSGQE